MWLIAHESPISPISLLPRSPFDQRVSCHLCFHCLQAIGVTNVSRAFWRADVKREPLQRVYAITFPDTKQLKEYQHRMEEVRIVKK